MVSDSKTDLEMKVKDCVSNDVQFKVKTVEGLSLCAYGVCLPCTYQSYPLVTLKKEVVYLCGHRPLMSL